MTIEQLCQVWNSGCRQLWYSYDGLFGSVKVWNTIDKFDDVIKDCVTNQLISCHNLINMRVPIDVHLYKDPSPRLQRYEFTVTWDIFLPDICGRNVIGINLETAENNENIFETYEECAEWCNKLNKNIIFNSSMNDSIFYLNLLKRLI